MTDEKSKKAMMDKKIIKSMRKFLLEYNRSIKDELVHAPSRMRTKRLLKYFKNNIKIRKSTGGGSIFRTFTHKENGFKKQYSFKLPKEKKEKVDKPKKKVEKKKPKKKVEKKRNPRSKGPSMKKGPPTTKAEYKKEKLAREKRIKAAKKKMLEDEAKRYKKA